MRILGALLFLVAGAGTGYSVWASLVKRRPRDILFGLAAPVALIVALTGLLLVFVPHFFGP